MAQKKARALKQGLPAINEMETSDLVDFLLQERRSFIAELETRNPPLSSAEAKHEIESFDEAVQLVLQDQIEAQRPQFENEGLENDGPKNQPKKKPRSNGNDYDLGERWLFSALLSRKRCRPPSNLLICMVSDNFT